jgi:DeoR family glycerol-3-phosphate regulon repressor
MNSRQQSILEQLRSGQELAVGELARQFDVSLVTIRRDLEALAQEGPITRTHGGVILSRAGVIEFSFQSRAQEQLEQKRALARHMAGVVKPGMTVVLDTGTTTLEVARAIGGTARLRVLTSSLAIASALQAHDNLDLVLLGGSVRHHSPDLSGPLTEDNLRQFRPDLAILGADAADREGVYTSDLGVAGISRAMIAGAMETWLVADSSKFSRRAFVQFADWGQIDHLITDDGLSPEDRQWTAEAVSAVHLVAWQ